MRERSLWVTVLGASGLVAAFALLKPNAFSATVKSPEAMLKIAGIAVAFVALSWVLRRFVRTAWLRSTVPTGRADA